MALQLLPDYIRGLILRFNTNTELFDMFPNLLVSGKIPTNRASRTFCLIPQKSGGDEDPYAPIGMPRVDIKYYGPTELEANRLFRAAHPLLIPITRRGFQFESGDCRFLDATMESGPMDLEEEDSSWPFVLVVYRFRIAQVAI
jgi:hypothetical protein